MKWLNTPELSHQQRLRRRWLSRNSNPIYVWSKNQCLLPWFHDKVSHNTTSSALLPLPFSTGPSPLFTSCAALHQQSPLGESGLLTRVVLTLVRASAQVVRNHTGCFAWREQDSSWQEQEPERVGVQQGCSFQWQSGPEVLMGLLCQLMQSFPVLNLVQSGNARYCCVVTASEFLPFEIMSTKCAASETFVAIYSNYVEGSVTEAGMFLLSPWHFFSFHFWWWNCVTSFSACGGYVSIFSNRAFCMEIHFRRNTMSP